MSEPKGHRHQERQVPNQGILLQSGAQTQQHDRTQRQQNVDRVVSAHIGQPFQNPVHAGLRTQREFTTMAVVIDLSKRNTSLDGLPHGFAGKKWWYCSNQQRNRPKQGHIAWVGWSEVG